MPKKSPPTRKPRAGSPARSTSRSTVSGPSKRRARSPGEEAQMQRAATEMVAEAFPFNAAKPTEFGEASAGAADGSDRRAAGSASAPAR